MTPFFSVIIPLYNKENYIIETLKSAINQTFTDFEVLIINDKSTDNSFEKAKQVKDSRIFFFNNNKNKGLSESRNIGISKAKGQIIALLDADDIWLPNYLEHLKKLHTQFPEASIYGTDYIEKYVFGDIAEIKKNISIKLKNKFFVIDDFFKANIYQPIICPSSTAFKKTILENHTVYNPKITYAEDIDFYINYCKKHKVAYNYKALVEKKSDVPNQITRNGISEKVIPDFDFYESWTKNNISLKKFLDHNRYIFAYNYILEKNIIKKNEILNLIDYNNLNFKQKIVLKSPLIFLIILKKIKLFFLKRGVRLTSI